MSEEKQLDIQEILKGFREIVGTQAQEIVILKATVAFLQQETSKVEQSYGNYSKGYLIPNLKR